MNTLLKVCTVLSVVGLAACNPLLNKAPKEGAFPTVEHSYLRDLPHYQAEDIKLVEVGQHKEQVRQVLGSPHFNEGVFSPKVWNYALGLKLDGYEGYQNCRLRIDFDRNNRVTQLTWKDQICADTVYGN